MREESNAVSQFNVGTLVSSYRTLHDAAKLAKRNLADALIELGHTEKIRARTMLPFTLSLQWFLVETDNQQSVWIGEHDAPETWSYYTFDCDVPREDRFRVYDGYAVVLVKRDVYIVLRHDQQVRPRGDVVAKSHDTINPDTL